MLASELHAVLDRLAGISVTARQAVEALLAGTHRSLRRGLSVEFAGHRPYQPGDDPRHLDWLLHARTDRFDVRLYDEETRLRATLLVDASGSHQYPGVAARSIALAGALAVLLARQGDAVGLALLSERNHLHLPAMSGLPAVGRLLDQLTALEPGGAREPGGPTALGQAVEQLAPFLPRRSLTVLISDCLDEPESLQRALRVLRHRRHEIRIIRVLHPDVEQFPLSGTVKCIGLENERPLLLDADRARTWYREAFARHALALSAASHACGAGLVVVRTDEDLTTALARVLAGWGAGTAAGATPPGSLSSSVNGGPS